MFSRHFLWFASIREWRGKSWCLSIWEIHDKLMRGKAAAAATTKNERNIWSDKRGPIGLFEQILVWRRRNKKLFLLMCQWCQFCLLVILRKGKWLLFNKTYAQIMYNLEYEFSFLIKTKLLATLVVYIVHFSVPFPLTCYF